MVKKIFDEAKEKMEARIEFFRRELSGIRTGRAATSLVENLKVDYYGSKTPLSQLASLSVPEPTVISIQPWDASAVQIIEKAIMMSDLGLTPANDGKVIRLSIPPLTEERRKELVKIVKKISEECKVAVRNIRRESMEQLKKKEKEKEISQDEQKKAQEEIQNVTNRFIKITDEITWKKEREVLEE
ncbi:MAG: ribosome recycling factor [Nitrospinota bacterium]